MQLKIKVSAKFLTFEIFLTKYPSVNHVQSVLSGATAAAQTQRSPVEPKIIGDISKTNTLRCLVIPLIPKSNDENSSIAADPNQLEQLQKMAADLPGVKFAEPDGWVQIGQIMPQPAPLSENLRRISYRRRPVPPFYFYPIRA